MSAAARAIATMPGRCRMCGCTELTPCRDRDGSPCGWLDPEHTLCDSVRCVARVPLEELCAIDGVPEDER